MFPTALRYYIQFVPECQAKNLLFFTFYAKSIANGETGEIPVRARRREVEKRLSVPAAANG